jgi:hypothetical protein
VISNTLNEHRVVPLSRALNDLMTEDSASSPKPAAFNAHSSLGRTHERSGRPQLRLVPADDDC